MARLFCALLLGYCTLLCQEAFAAGRTVLQFDNSGNIVGSYVAGVGGPVQRVQAQQAGVLEAKLISMGFEPSSPVASTTVDAVSTVVGTLAAGAVAATTAPAWMSIAVGAVAATLAGKAISYAVGAAWNWLFNSDKTVTVSGAVATAPGGGGTGGATLPPVVGMGGFKHGSAVFISTAPMPTVLNDAGQTPMQLLGGHTVTVGSLDQFVLVAQADMCRPYPIGPISGCSVARVAGEVGNTVNVVETLTYNDARVPSTATFTPLSTIGFIQQLWQGSDCGSYGLDSACQDSVAPTNPNGVKSQADAVAAAQPDASKPLSPDAVAQLVNALWQMASQQPGYSGAPYNAANPVTAGDVSTWNAANPSWAPTLGDYISSGGSADPSSPATGTSGFNLPQPQVGSTPTGGGTDPSNPASGTGSTSTTVVTGASSVSVNVTNTTTVSIDTCKDNPTSVGCQSLGSPTDTSVLPQSTFNATLSAVSVGGPVGSCPSPVAFVVFGQSFAISYDPLCSLATALRGVVLALCALGAGMIVVSGIKS